MPNRVSIHIPPSSRASAPPRGRSGAGPCTQARSPREGVGREAVAPGGVADVDPHLVLLGPGEPERLQPRRVPGSRDRWRRPPDRRRGPPLRSRRRAAARRTPVTRRRSGEGRRPTTSPGGAKRTPGRARTRARTRSSRSGRLALSASSPVSARARRWPPNSSRASPSTSPTGAPARHQVGGQAGEQLLQHLLAAGEQRVDVPALRRARPRRAARASPSRSTTVTCG